MDLTYTPEQERLRQQLRAYFTGLMTRDVRAALTAAEGEYGNGEAYRLLVRQLGRDGWLALSWPPEYGAAARPRSTSSSSPTRRPPPGCPCPS
jgi:alkylation response protein AidB-like acyl-CoA dehydrogenase